MTSRFHYRSEVKANWKLYMDAFQEFYHAPVLHANQSPAKYSKAAAEAGFEAPHYRIDGPHRLVSTSGIRAWEMDSEMRKPMEDICQSGLFGPWDKPDLGEMPAGLNPAKCDPWGLDSFQLFPNFVILVWGQGLVSDLPLLADVVSTPTSSRARCTSRSRARRASASPRNWPRCRSRSTACRTPNTLEATQTMVESGWSTSSCCATRRCATLFSATPRRVRRVAAFRYRWWQTNDFFLSDTPSWTIGADEVIAALESASEGPVPEGNVGGGTGNVGYLFKAGIGTASKKAKTPSGEYTVGILVQSNHGRREDFCYAGLPVGRVIGADLVPFPKVVADDPYLIVPAFFAAAEKKYKEDGSVIIVIATYADGASVRPLGAAAVVGLGRTGGFGNNSSGDFCLCFSTGNRLPQGPVKTISGLAMMPNEHMTPLFQATVEATESALINSLLMAETMIGRRGNTAWALSPCEIFFAGASRGRRPCPGPILICWRSA